MRNYPRNSPQAAARIVALALMADGHLSQDEINALRRVDAPKQLGLSQDGMHLIVHGLCEDLLVDAEMAWSNACRIDPAALAQVMAELDDPLLRIKVLRLCLAVVNADNHVSEGESIVLSAALDAWGQDHTGMAATHASMASARG